MAPIVKRTYAEVVLLTCSFDEVHVFDAVAERTGTQLERAGVRGRPGVCRSLRQLTAMCRRMGDGYYYLTSTAWPAGATSLNLTQSWSPMS
jgi:hypothetical protein